MLDDEQAAITYLRSKKALILNGRQRVEKLEVGI
jgi:hypothetical protein